MNQSAPLNQLNLSQNHYLFYMNFAPTKKPWEVSLENPRLLTLSFDTVSQTITLYSMNFLNLKNTSRFNPFLKAIKGAKTCKLYLC